MSETKTRVLSDGSSISVDPNGTVVCKGKAAVNVFRLLALKGALKLEVKGIRLTRGSAYAAIKREFGFKGNKEKVLQQYEAMLREMGVLVEHD